MAHIYTEQQAQSVAAQQVFALTGAKVGSSGQSIFRHTTGDKPLRVAVKNNDAAIIQYIGAVGVTSATGFPLAAGQTVTWDIYSLQDLTDLYCIAASGTPTLGILVIGPLSGN